MSSYELGFLGAGNMAEAIVKAAISRGVLSAGQMIACDPAENRRQLFTSLGVVIAKDNTQVIAQAKQVLIAVKPQAFEQLAADLARHLRPDQILISIMAGISTAKFTQMVHNAGSSQPLRIIRVMPNTPLMVGCGMAGIALGPQAHEGDDALALRLFSAGGQAIRVAEQQIDAITAVSGSGPAYVFYLAQAMEHAAADLGLGEHARTLVAQTILGAAQLLLQSADSPAELRKKVTSPGGTTQAAVSVLDGHQTLEVIVQAIHAAQKRSLELGK